MNTSREVITTLCIGGAGVMTSLNPSSLFTRPIYRTRPCICAVYAIRHSITHRVYIGYSKDVTRRWQGHRHALRRGTHHSYALQQDWNRDGEDAFMFEVLEEALPQNVRAIEQRWLTTLSPYYNTVAVRPRQQRPPIQQRYPYTCVLCYAPILPATMVVFEGKIMHEECPPVRPLQP